MAFFAPGLFQVLGRAYDLKYTKTHLQLFSDNKNLYVSVTLLLITFPGHGG